MSDPTRMGAEEQLPPSLQVLSEDLSAPGPALPLSAADAERLITSALKGPRSAALGGVGGAARRRRAAGVVALVLLGSSAAAAWYQHRVSARERALAQATASADRQAEREATQPKRVPQPETTAQVEIVSNEAAAPAQASDSVVRAVESPARAAPAEDLLQKASRLRREGQLKEAEQVYLQLVQREPQSSSAYVARVAVAELRIGRNPAGAIELLQAAVRYFPQGPLDIEIHQLLAQGYRATGNVTLERSALTRLTTRHSGSIAADRARTRLNELGNP
jgi:TolA-binding protein